MLQRGAIPDKQTALRLWLAGEFGNRTRTWSAVEFRRAADSCPAGLPPLFGIRFVRRPGVPYVETWRADLPAEEILAFLDRWRRARTSVPGKLREALVRQEGDPE